MTKKEQAFKKMVLEFYAKEGRHELPWRKKRTPYAIAVSEIMLQQTQVDRVIPFFKKWMREFPSWRALSRAPQSKVLSCWKGLGYNSRALRLHKLAKNLVEHHRGRMPSSYDELLKLPGIGPYTAGAIRAFAFNLYTPIIETNIRRVFIHHFFANRENVDDREIMKMMMRFEPVEEPRDWYAALMDYGARLPKIIKRNPNTQSKHYTKQAQFEGSNRQLRGRILEILLAQKNHSMSEQKLFAKLGQQRVRYKRIITQMKKENFLEKVGQNYLLK